eukprot:Rhum_TRINITY_DN18794_c0_g1::Rhum_TRINITY_DN18794_c0_g1_i1::g.168429::m.168429
MVCVVQRPRPEVAVKAAEVVVWAVIVSAAVSPTEAEPAHTRSRLRDCGPAHSVAAAHHRVGSCFAEADFRGVQDLNLHCARLRPRAGSACRAVAHGDVLLPCSRRREHHPVADAAQTVDVSNPARRDQVGPRGRLFRDVCVEQAVELNREGPPLGDHMGEAGVPRRDAGDGGVRRAVVVEEAKGGNVASREPGALSDGARRHDRALPVRGEVEHAVVHDGVVIIGSDVAASRGRDLAELRAQAGRRSRRHHLHVVIAVQPGVLVSQPERVQDLVKHDTPAAPGRQHDVVDERGTTGPPNRRQAALRVRDKLVVRLRAGGLRLALLEGDARLCRDQRQSLKDPRLPRGERTRRARGRRRINEIADVFPVFPHVALVSEGDSAQSVAVSNIIFPHKNITFNPVGDAVDDPTLDFLPRRAPTHRSACRRDNAHLCGTHVVPTPAAS